MNVDVRILFTDGERAARDGQRELARRCFLEAAECALGVQLWRTALRCYRHALELDLFDRDVVERIARLPPRIISGRGWDAYRSALARPAGERFGCRAAQVVIGNAGAFVECPGGGAVLELLMSEDDLIELRPAERYRWMPSAMALVILRRAMWPAPRDRSDPQTLRVTYDGHERVRLDEHGDWEPIVGS